jgi:hypothetical protein
MARPVFLKSTCFGANAPSLLRFCNYKRKGFTQNFVKMSDAFKNRLRRKFLQLLQIFFPFKGKNLGKETYFGILSSMLFPVHSWVFVHL